MTGLSTLIRTIRTQGLDLPGTHIGIWAHADQSWARIGRAATRALQQLGSTTPGSSRGPELILEGFSTNAADTPPLGVYEPLECLATKIGAAADMLTQPTHCSAELQSRAGELVRVEVLNAVAGAARWTQSGLPKPPRGYGMFASQLDRIAHAQQPVWSGEDLAFYPWRSPHSGLEATVHSWLATVRDALSSEQNVTQLALQLTAAHIATLCLSGADLLLRAPHGVWPDVGRQLAAPLTHAASEWREAARWPDHLRLGGRTSDLREASSELRSALTGGTNGRSIDHLEVLLWSIQSAQVAGAMHVAALDALSFGRHSLWVDTSQVPRPASVVSERRRAWIPDSEPSRQSERPRLQSAKALQALRHTRHEVDGAIAKGTLHGIPATTHTTPVWEVVPPPRAEQVRRHARDVHDNSRARALNRITELPRYRGV